MGRWNMAEERKEIILPKQTQTEMMKFFLKTSIPRKKKQQLKNLSNSSDRSSS